jgi:hypothetical protein
MKCDASQKPPPPKTRPRNKMWTGSGAAAAASRGSGGRVLTRGGAARVITRNGKALLEHQQQHPFKQQQQQQQHQPFKTASRGRGRGGKGSVRSAVKSYAEVCFSNPLAAAASSINETTVPATVWHWGVSGRIDAASRDQFIDEVVRTASVFSTQAPMRTYVAAST